MKALEDKPDLYEDVQDAWNAWSYLHIHRPTGLGVTPLAVNDIAAFLNLYEFDEEKRIDTFKFICALETAWLDWARDPKREEERKKDAVEKQKSNREKAMEQLGKPNKG